MIAQQISFVNTFLSINDNIFLFCIKPTLNFGAFCTNIELYILSDSKSLKKNAFCDRINTKGEIGMENQFYSMLSRMKLINRWGLMRNTRNENISEHSLETAMIAHSLAVIGNTYFGKSYNAERCALLGVFHDVTEIITGDLPTPVKYGSPEIRSAYKQVEDNAKNRLVSMLPEEMQVEISPLLSPDENTSDEERELWRLVKAADKLSALIKCIEERVTGNTDFASAEKATLRSIEEMAMPEADYFIKNFLPSYGKTLDEQA